MKVKIDKYFSGFTPYFVFNSPMGKEYEVTEETFNKYKQAVKNLREVTNSLTHEMVWKTADVKEKKI